jgi:hypothetical protein
MVRTAPPFVRALASTHRVLLLGGLAVVSHGLSRLTKDVDVWLEPHVSVEAWADALQIELARFDDAYLWDLSRRERILAAEIPTVVSSVGVVRVGGLECDLDVFRVPNNLDIEDFDVAWRDSVPLGNEPFRVMDEPLLIATKVDTERQQDRDDITFLESRIREKFAPILAECAPEKARALFARYADHVTCEAALKNPYPAVRDLAIETLREFAAGQNPFAREILRELGENPA